MPPRRLLMNSRRRIVVPLHLNGVSSADGRTEPRVFALADQVAECGVKRLALASTDFGEAFKPTDPIIRIDGDAFRTGVLREFSAGQHGSTFDGGPSPGEVWGWELWVRREASGRARHDWATFGTVGVLSVAMRDRDIDAVRLDEYPPHGGDDGSAAGFSVPRRPTVKRVNNSGFPQSHVAGHKEFACPNACIVRLTTC
jgi:hypothetical protein